MKSFSPQMRIKLKVTHHWREHVLSSNEYVLYYLERWSGGRETGFIGSIINKSTCRVNFWHAQSTNEACVLDLHCCVGWRLELKVVRSDLFPPDSGSRCNSLYVNLSPSCCRRADDFLLSLTIELSDDVISRSSSAPNSHRPLGTVFVILFLSGNQNSLTEAL